MADSPDLVNVALKDIRCQQELLSQSISALSSQHKEWQRAVELLLAKVDTLDTQQIAPVALAVPTYLSAPATAEVQGPQDQVSEFEGSEGLEQDRRPSLKLVQHNHEGALPQLVQELMADVHSLQEEGSQRGYWSQKRRHFTKFIESSFFEYLTGAIIFANIITIGIEADMSIKGEEEVAAWAVYVEQGFLAVYTVELALRLLAGGLLLFTSCWFLLDFFLICVGMLAVVVAPAITGGGSDMDGFQKLLVVRGLRLLRLARVLRMVGRFKVVWRLVSGLLTAWETMLSATVLIILWLFIFACISVELISSDPELLSHAVTGPIVDYSFGSLPRAMLTLVQFVTLDSIAGVYYPIIIEKPWLVFLFMPLMVLISVGLMNLVTAVLVEHALSHASREEELARLRTKQKIKQCLPDLLKIFESLDADGSGQVTRAEAAAVPLSILPPKVLATVSVESMEDLFQMLDVDDGGTLSQAEFLEGLLSLLLLDVPIWAIQALKLLRPIRMQTLQLSRDLSDIKNHLRMDLVSM